MECAVNPVRQDGEARPVSGKNIMLSIKMKNDSAIFDNDAAVARAKASSEKLKERIVGTLNSVEDSEQP